MKFIFVSPVRASHDGDDSAARVPTPAAFTGAPAPPAASTAVALTATITIEHPSVTSTPRCLCIVPPVRP